MNVDNSITQGTLECGPNAGFDQSVKGVDDEQITAAEIDELIEDVLDGATLTIAGYTNLRTWRDNEVQMTETAPDGTHIFHRGAYYAIMIDS